MHKIVYLDQSYLSNMAKARCGLVNDTEQATFWSSFFNDLKQAVLSDKIACPELEFQRHEAMYDRRLEEPVRNVIDELSWGLSFLQSDYILQLQIDEAAMSFLGKPRSVEQPWSKVFQSDPQAPVESRMQDILGIKSRINVHLTLSDEVVKHDRELKRQFAKGAQLLKHDTSGWDWSDVVKSEKLSFIFVIFGLQTQYPIYQQLRSGLPLEEFIAAARLTELNKHWARLCEIGIDIRDTNLAAQFLTSDELLNAPYIDIYCSINAAKIMYYPTRIERESDFYDIPILATTLPYCDVVTTDAFMKHLVVDILQFDDKYEAQLFCAKKRDRLVFKELVEQIISAN